MADLGKILVAVGGMLILAGGVFLLLGRFGGLPGDVQVRRGNFTFIFPVVTCIVLSLVLTIVLQLIARLRR